MATGNVTPAPLKPAADEHESLAAALSAENRVAFRQATLALVQAEAAFKEAVRAAEEERRKPAIAFEAAKQAYDSAMEKLTDDSVRSAEEILTLLRQEAGDTKAADLIDRGPDEAKRQIARLQDTLDKYKAGVAAVAAQMQSVDEAKLALRKLSEPEEPFDPEKPVMNRMAERIADEQYQLAIAEAQIPRDAAKGAFELKTAQLTGTSRLQ